MSECIIALWKDCIFIFLVGCVGKESMCTGTTGRALHMWGCFLGDYFDMGNLMLVPPPPRHSSVHYAHEPFSSCGLRMRRECRGVFPPPRVSDPDMHHDTGVTHVPWCMTGSLTSGLIWRKRPRHSRRMHNPQLYVSGEGPMHWITDKVIQ